MLKSASVQHEGKHHHLISSVEGSAFHSTASTNSLVFSFKPHPITLCQTLQTLSTTVLKWEVALYERVTKMLSALSVDVRVYSGETEMNLGDLTQVSYMHCYWLHTSLTCQRWVQGV